MERYRHFYLGARFSLLHLVGRGGKFSKFGGQQLYPGDPHTFQLWPVSLPIEQLATAARILNTIDDILVYDYIKCCLTLIPM